MKLKPIFFIAIFLVSSVLLKGQLMNDPLVDIYQHENDSARFFGLNAGVQSNPALPLSYVSYFLPLQYASDDQVFSKMKDQEFFEQFFQLNAVYSQVLKSHSPKRRNRLSLLYQTKARQQATISKDALTLLLKGNNDFAGQVVDAGGFSFQALVSQELTLSYQMKKLLDNHRYYFMGIGFSGIAVQDFYDLSLHSASLFTSATGDSVNLRIHADGTLPDMLQPSNGLSAWGVGLQAQFGYRFSNASVFYLSVSDVGFLRGTKKMKYYSLDTSVSFTGFDVFNPGANDEWNTWTSDSLLNKYVRGESQDKLLFLSPVFRMQFQYKNIFTHAHLNLGAAYRVGSYLPGIYSTIRFDVSESFYLQPGLNLDPYGNMGLCFEMGMQLKNGFEWLLGSNHMEGLGLFPYNGQSVYLKSRWLF
jgi:hypothetical protein